MRVRDMSELQTQEDQQALAERLSQWMDPEWPDPQSPADVELNFYEKFFFSRDIEPYHVQEEAFNQIFAGKNLLVMVPTGTGKTMIAKAGLMKALYSRKTAIYTTPLRALTEEKYRELCADFGAKYVGFATGDYKINPRAPIQVMVAEIVWNMIYSGRRYHPADIVVMDEGHYFNDPERGYVWEQSIIGLDASSQLIILSATIGNPEQFCQWTYLVRHTPMSLVKSDLRRVPLFHQYEEKYLIEQVRELQNAGDIPAIIFCFSRQQCFDYARLLKSCSRFTTDEEQAEIAKRAAQVVFPRGLGDTLLSFLKHGIGIHHSGILPSYKQLIEELTLERLLKFVVSTETISAGINLPAKRVIFPSIRKHVRRQARILLPAEYHQMAGRAGRPQFDTEGIAITLAPEEVVQEFRKELKDAQKSKRAFDAEKIRQRAYSRARTEALKRNDITWNPEEHKKLVEGQPAALRSHTKITAEQILAIGLPDLTTTELPGVALVEAEKQAEAKRQAEREALLLQKQNAPTETASAPAEKSARHAPLPNKFAQLGALLEAKQNSEDESNTETSENTDSSDSSDSSTQDNAPESAEASTQSKDAAPSTQDSGSKEDETLDASEHSEDLDVSASSETEDDSSEQSAESGVVASEDSEAAEGETSPEASVETEASAESSAENPQGEAPREKRRKKVEPWPEHLPKTDVLSAILANGTRWPKDVPLPPPLISVRLSPPSIVARFDISSIIDHLFLDDNEKRESQKLLVKITNNLRALGILDEHGIQRRGWLISELQGIDGPFVYYCLMHHDLDYFQVRELLELLVDHDVIYKHLNRKIEDEKREWMRNRLRDRRRDEPHVTWEDVEADYAAAFPRKLVFIEEVHDRFLKSVPHPELHGGKKFKMVWSQMEDAKQSFLNFVEEHGLEQEEGNLFSYLSRMMKTAKTLYEHTQIAEFRQIENRIRGKLGMIDERVLDLLWYRIPPQE